MALKRLFGNENSEHRSPVAEDGWELEGFIGRAAAAVEAAPAQQLPPLPGQAPTLSPTFPYPQKFLVQFGTAQAAELFLPIAGYVVSFWDSTNLTDVVNVRFARSNGDIAGPPLPFRPGHALGVGDFTWIGLTWAQIIGATGTLVILPRGVLLDENR